MVTDDVTIVMTSIVTMVLLRTYSDVNAEYINECAVHSSQSASLLMRLSICGLCKLH